MAVYARGYRPFVSDFRGPPAFLTIFREGYRSAFKSRGFRFIGILFLVWFVVWAIALYAQVGQQERIERFTGRQATEHAQYSARVLAETLRSFYAIGISVLTALLAMLVGSGLIADDLRTKALPLYLVRPLRPVDYVIGKALILPGILAWMTLAPGLGFYLLVGFWQKPGESFAFLADNVDVVGVVVKHFFVACASYVGLMLLLSSRTPRRGAVASLAAAVIFGGTMLYGLGRTVGGSGGDAFRLLSLPWNSIEGFFRHASRNRDGLFVRRLPDPEGVVVIAVVLLVAGLLAAYRRARSVEVAG